MIARPSPDDSLTKENFRSAYVARSEQYGIVISDGPSFDSRRAEVLSVVNMGQLQILAEWLVETWRMPDRHVLVEWLTDDDDMVRWLAYLGLRLKIGQAFEDCAFFPNFPLDGEANRAALPKIRKLICR